MCRRRGTLIDSRWGYRATDAEKGELNALVDASEWKARQATSIADPGVQDGGRNLFDNMRQSISSAETGALTLFNPDLH